MNTKLDTLLLSLDDEIDKKCFELKEKRHNQKQERLFYFICGLFVLVPSLLAFLGVNILLLIAPIIIFSAIFMFALSPIILFNSTKGVENEKI